MDQNMILSDDTYQNVRENEGMSTNTHTHRYVPAQTKKHWVAAPVETGHTSRYYPVTAKDAQLHRQDILQYDAYKDVKENEGMSTATHGSRYYPARAQKA
jgi:hypothetical protein